MQIVSHVVLLSLPCQGIIDKSAFSLPNNKDSFQHRRRRERQAFALAYERRGLGQVGMIHAVHPVSSTIIHISSFNSPYLISHHKQGTIWDDI